MTEHRPELKSAVSLMRMALALLDKAGDATSATCHLQAAIDDATGAKPLQPGDEIHPDLLATFFVSPTGHTGAKSVGEGESR